MKIEFKVGKDTFVAEVQPSGDGHLVTLEDQPFPFKVIDDRVYHGETALTYLLGSRAGEQRLLCLAARDAFLSVA